MQFMLLLLISLTTTCAAQDVLQFAGANRTVVLPTGVTVTAADGSLVWPGLARAAQLVVLPNLATVSECQAILAALPPDFDEDGDSVDQMATYEFYLVSNGSPARARDIAGKPDRGRHVQRRALIRLTRPILEQRITPFVNAHFPQCHGSCFPCFSFIRRFDPSERRTHATHFDLQALVTVVVSLNSFGRDFSGGLYVTTGRDDRFLALHEGDAVAHQSDLLHGVRVDAGQRRSWVLWFHDTPNCNANPTEWQTNLVQEGDAVAEFIQAHRVFAYLSATNISAAHSAKLALLNASAQHGFTRAQNELGSMLQHGLGVAANLSAAKALFQQASHAEPDATYNLGLMLLAEKKETEAVEMFQTAARFGSLPAAHNLGVAYLAGSGVGQDAQTALKWFLKAGLSESMRMAGLIFLQHIAPPRPRDGIALLARACKAGDNPAWFAEHIQKNAAELTLINSDLAARAMLQSDEYSMRDVQPLLARAAQRGDVSAAATLQMLLTAHALEDGGRDEL